MPPHGRYAHAPITEALIDLRCSLPPDITLETLARIHGDEKERYPKRNERVNVEGSFTAGREVSAAAKQRQVGFMFWDGAQTQAFQARLDGYTFNRLAPYEHWDTFRDEARRLWDRYRELARPKGISRIAVRYINRLDLPLPLSDFKDYLRTVPEVAAELPQGLAGFVMGLQIPQEDLDAMVLLHEAMDEPHHEGVASIILDVDLFRQFDPLIEEDLAWSLLEQFRVRKNEIFEASITDKMREIIR
jgi:uncharacterized protein (TIGR04255 family)